MTVIRDERLTASFRASEFRCRCRAASCDAPPMDKAFMVKLQALRDEWGGRLLISSGSRCSAWNAKVGGSPNSMHMQGLAADIRLDSADQGPRISAIAEKVGFSGIGVGKAFIHVDCGEPGRRWRYE